MNPDWGKKKKMVSGFGYQHETGFKPSDFGSTYNELKVAAHQKYSWGKTHR